jgi:hypothetical protein
MGIIQGVSSGKLQVLLEDDSIREFDQRDPDVVLM